jgi:hypothetical protein
MANIDQFLFHNSFLQLITEKVYLQIIDQLSMLHLLIVACMMMLWVERLDKDVLHRGMAEVEDMVANRLRRQ